MEPCVRVDPNRSTGIQVVLMPTVKFTNENVEIEVPEGAVLRKEAKRVGVNSNLGFNGLGQQINRYVNCMGKGMCGTCRVLIREGAENVNPPTLTEKIQFKVPVLPDPLPKFAYAQYGESLRLACQVKVLGDIEVELGPKIDLFGENFFS